METQCTIVVAVMSPDDPVEECLRHLTATSPADTTIVVIDATGTVATSVVGSRMQLALCKAETYAAAVAAGIRRAPGRAVAIVSPFVRPEPGWWQAALTVLENPRVGMVGGTLVDDTGRVQQAGFLTNSAGRPIDIWAGLPAEFMGDEAHDVAVADLRFAVAHRAVWESTGALAAASRVESSVVDACMALWEHGGEVRTTSRMRAAWAGPYEFPGWLQTQGQAVMEAIHRLAPATRERVSPDGIHEAIVADCVWLGPLFDASDEAATGRRWLQALSAQGYRPIAYETVVGDCDTSREVPEEVADAIRRQMVGVYRPVVFRHGAGRTAALSPLVPVDNVTVAVGEGDPVDGAAVTVDADVADPMSALDAAGIDLHRPWGLCWIGLVHGRSGYANASRGMLESARSRDVPVRVYPMDAPPEYEQPTFWNLMLYGAPYVVAHCAPVWSQGWRYQSSSLGMPLIGAACFETTSFPPSWLPDMQCATEIWVPTEFNRRTFTAGGIDPDILHCIPYPVDEKAYCPSSTPPSDDGTFVFFSVFEWAWRKGWDLLLEAYLTEFTAADDVSLDILTYRHNPYSGEALEVEALNHIVALGFDPGEIPDVHLLLDPLTTPQLIERYRTCGAFVLPTRGEGAGMPVLEAAACGAPVIATAWGGHEELMQPEMAFPVELDGFVDVPDDSSVGLNEDVFRGQSLANPSVASLRSNMRAAYENRADARRRARVARAYIEQHFSIEAAARAFSARCEALVPQAGSRRYGRAMSPLVRPPAVSIAA